MEDVSMIGGDDVRLPMTHDEGVSTGMTVEQELQDDNDNDDVDGIDEAAAAAQVALMDGHFNNRTGRGNQANRAAEEAILGASTDDVEAYMDQDESGNLVEQRFLQFLESL